MAAHGDFDHVSDAGRAAVVDKVRDCLRAIPGEASLRMFGLAENQKRMLQLCEMSVDRRSRACRHDERHGCLENCVKL